MFSRRVREYSMTYAFRDPAVPLSPAQLELRVLVYEQALRDPGSFDMRDWERTPWSLRWSESRCKTTRCVAGWAQFIRRGKVYEDGNEELGIPPVDADATGLLGLTEDEYGGDAYGADGLFYLDDEDALERLRELAGLTQREAAADDARLE
jgi:hypothetical protein